MTNPENLKVSSESKWTGYYEIGTIVTLKSHPLAFDKDGLIDSYISHIPPYMCVKEVHTENKKQRYSPEHGKQIADEIKYLCVYFNQHRTIFEEKYLYHSMLFELKPENFIFHKKNEKTDYLPSLIEETLGYSQAEYEYGKRVFFKTHKVEKRKKFKDSRASSDQSKYNIAMAHTSPAFIMSGLKKNDLQNLYYEKNGEPKRLVTETLVKVLWYNSYQEKMSEEYLPIEFFTDDEKIHDSTDNFKKGQQKYQTRFL